MLSERCLFSLGARFRRRRRGDGGAEIVGDGIRGTTSP